MDAAIQEIKKGIHDANITFPELDLAFLGSVRKAADKFKASSNKLDILMNNAGVMALPASLTEDGYEV